MNSARFNLFILYFNIMCIFRTSQFYVPGMAPVEFKKGQQIDVKAVKMTSVHTQLPYEYYSLPFCLPKNGSFHYKSENLGEVLRGDRIVNTPYIVKMAEDVQCSLLCHFPNKPMHWSAEDSQRVIDRIQHEYFVHLLVDNLPAATPIFNQDLRDIQYEHGYRLGNVIGDKNYINNHLKLTLFYHNPAPEIYRVVGFHVQAKSVHIGDLKFIDNTCTFPTKSRGQLVDSTAGTTLYFTYEIEWRHSKISWASRWDTYLAMNDVQIHWFSIINSLVVIFFLSDDSDRRGRKKIREFTGFKYDKNADEYKNKSAFVKQSFSVAELVAVCNLLHLDYEGSLEELTEKIMGALINVDSLRKENKKDYDEEDEYDDSEEDDNDEQEDVERKDDEEQKKIKENKDEKTPRFPISFRDVEDSMRTFDGSEDFSVEKWIEEFEDNAELMEWNDLHKYIFAKKSLRGLAKLYIQGEAGLNSWRSLKRAGRSRTELLEEFKAGIIEGIFNEN
ncbi:Endomembrane protein 70 [Popillia japonica]|uniref:Transmembrane 9 superfamily member n=1 Tax=Popillia japonica TaxID=7064 RepID=A0AAW1IS48_POPJA